MPEMCHNKGEGTSMEKTDWQGIVRNVLVLAALTGMVLVGWLAGHILRFSIPAYQFQHPPIQENDSHIKNGYEFQLKGAAFSITPADSPWVKAYLGDEQQGLSPRCIALTYYTSMPAKCLTVDGQLVQVGGTETNVIVLPSDK